MRFIKSKYSKEIYWTAAIIATEQMERDRFYIIRPRGAGFDLLKTMGSGRKPEKICHVRKFDSAKQIATLIERG